MDSALFDYTLPPDRIAQEPAAQRDASRLMVVRRDTQQVEHRLFSELPGLLGPGEALFRNNAKVLPARLHAERPTGGQVECLLLRPATDDAMEWWTLLRPGKRLPPGASFALPGSFEARVLEKNAQAEYRVGFALHQHESVAALAEAMGKMPLPPYIQRQREDARDAADKSRYQTIYATGDQAVAAAAPTAGLHFSPGLVEQLESRGARFHDLSLHVGMGTFKPLETERIEDHQIHREVYELPATTQRALREPEGRRRVAVGTTSVRSIEDYLRKTDHLHPAGFTGEAGLFIHPPYRFLGVDALITNFHLPRSTLLCLVSAFLDPGGLRGIDWLKRLYAEAIERRYRFLSYGDAMLIL